MLDELIADHASALKAKQANVDTSRKALSKAQKRLCGTTSTRKEIRKEIRTEEKAKAKENSERDSVADASAMRIALDALPKAQDKLDYLRLQIEMRVRGLGFVQFRPRMRWSSSKDVDVGTVAELTVLLEEILVEEHELDCCDDLPDAAVVPTMRRKSFKELGTPTAQATDLAVNIKAYSHILPRGAA